MGKKKPTQAPPASAFHRPFAGLKGLTQGGTTTARAATAEPKSDKVAPKGGVRAADAQQAELPARLPSAVVCDSDTADDATMFRRAVRDVSPLTDRQDKITRSPHAAAVPPDDDQAVLAEMTALVRGHGPFKLSASAEELWGLAPGVNLQLLNDLRAGRFAFRLHLDLHGHSQESAHAELCRFIPHARRQAERCVLIVTGRGRKSPGGVSVLRETLPRWLSRAPLNAHVLAFCTARAQDGGPGAYYVLLRRAGVKPFGAQL